MSEFRYKRYMRDGSVEERVALPDDRRVRKGKTAKKHKRHKA